MGFFTKFNSALSGMFSSKGASHKALPPGDAPSLIRSIMQSQSMPRRGSAELLVAYKSLPWLRSVVDRISNAVASARWVVYKIPGSLDKRKYKNATFAERLEIRKNLGDYGRMEEVDTPLLGIFENANPSMTGRALRLLMQNYMELVGECFLMIERNSDGLPTELWPIPSTWVKKIPGKDDSHFEIRYQGLDLRVSRYDMIWTRNPDPSNPYGRGTGVAESLGDELDADEYAAKHVKSWFYNRATPDLLVGIKGASEAQLKGAKQAWEDNHKGVERAYGSHWHSGELQVNQLSQTFADQQLVEFRQFERDIIVNTFGVPPEILGILENSNRATIESADYLFSRWVIVPRLEFVRTEFQQSLVPMFGDDLVLEYINPVPEDKEHMLQVARSAPYAFTVNEIRAMGSHHPLDGDGGESHWVPLNGVLVPDLAHPTEAQEEEELLETEDEVPQEEVEQVEEEVEAKDINSKTQTEDVPYEVV
jgi:HK97 family phage portal protein